MTVKLNQAPQYKIAETFFIFTFGGLRYFFSVFLVCNSHRVIFIGHFLFSWYFVFK